VGRSLIWVQSDADAGWACSQCRWRFSVPTLLASKDAKDAYDRLAAAKFREHSCEPETLPASPTPNLGPTFADRARALIKKGYKPKDAIDLVLGEIAFEHHNDPSAMERARADADSFLLKIRKGLI
jgi:hypothetical protein